jgi:tetratricopeptide (TPR) repeat protein
MNEALADFRQTLTIKPKYIMAHYQAGIIFMDAKEFRDYSAAEDEFQAMQDIDKDNEYSNLGLARLYIIKNNPFKALELCERIEARNPDISEVNYLRGYIYGKKSSPLYDRQRAIEYYNKYLSTTTDNISAYLNRGDLLQQAGKIDAAIADYNQALKLNPDYVWALNNRGWIYYSIKDNTEKALADFNRASSADPEYYWTYMNRAAVYEYLGNWQKAEEDYNWAHDLKPDAYIVIMRQGECFLRQGKIKEALNRLNTSLNKATSAKLPLIYHDIAMAHVAIGQFEEAYEALKKISLKLHPHPFYPAALKHLCMLKSGQSPDPTNLQKYADKEKSRPWLSKIVRCWRGLDIAEKEIDKMTGEREICESGFYLGMYALIFEKNPNKALAFLKKSAGTNAHLHNEFIVSKLTLKRIGKTVDNKTVQ